MQDQSRTMQDYTFREFPELSQEERAKILEEFTSAFQPSDWWHMDALLRKRSGYRYFDIVPALPIELAVQILQYIPLPDLVVNRRVSRRWLQTLSSEAICRGLALELFPKQSWRSYLYKQCDGYVKVSTWKQIVEDIASRNHFASRGKFLKFSKFDTLDITFDRYPESISVALNRHNLAVRKYGANESCEIIVWNLDKREEILRVSVPNRERVVDLALSSDFVTVFTYTGTCYAFLLHSGERKTLRTESAMLQQLIAVIDKVALIFSDGKAIIWNTNGESCSIALSKPQYATVECTYYLDHINHVLLRFQFDEIGSPVQFDRFTYWSGGERKIESQPLRTVLGSDPPSTIHIHHNERFKFTQLMPDNSTCKIGGLLRRGEYPEGLRIPKLVYNTKEAEWNVSQNIAYPADYPPPFFALTQIYATPEAVLFLTRKRRPQEPGLGRLNFYKSDEAKWVEWDQTAWGTVCWIMAASDRYIVVALTDGSVEVRRIVGIHERKELEEQIAEEANDKGEALIWTG